MFLIYIALTVVTYFVYKCILKKGIIKDMFRRFNWTRYSPKLLQVAEEQVLSFLKTPYTGRFVDIGSIVGSRTNKIWTITMNESSKEIPIVLLHGMGAGVGLWAMNLDQLAQDRPVYAMDLLGFGRSSRPYFSTDAKIVEMQMVAAIEEWRREVKLEKFILLGHSLGAYLGLSYSMQYPARVEHLIMADPWGLSETPASVVKYYGMNLRKRFMSSVLVHTNPLLGIRVAGPWGEDLIRTMRPDLCTAFAPLIYKSERAIPKYIHQCNSQNPTGETAFHTMMHRFAFAKNPQIHRIHRLSEDIPLTIVYGSKSWVDKRAGHKIKQDRPNSYVNVEIQEGSAHHVNFDQPDIFNKYVLNACHYKKNMQRSQ